MAVTTKKTFPATSNSTTTTFGPIGIELNNQDDLDVYITESGGTRVLQYKQSSASTTDSNHPQVGDTTGLYFPPVASGVALKNYTISADNNNVIFNSALPSGAVVSVERRTRDSSSSYTSFSSGSTIRSTDLNTAFDEARFTAQEGRNKAFDLERQTFSEDGNLRLLEDQSLVYEGATDDGYETTLAITDPTADRTITFPNVSGNVVTTGDTGTVTSTMLLDGTIVNADVNASAAIAGTKVNPDFGSQVVTTTGNIVVGGTVDGRDVAADGTKLDAIEASATGDQTNAEIRAAVEAASDSNVFTDADHTKLNGIAASANNYSISSDLLDEDNMASNSATKAASQQSIKAYVDAQSSEITVQDEGSALTTAATTLNFTGSGVTASGTGATKTITITGGGGGGGAVTTDYQYLELKAHNNAAGAFSAGAADYELVTKGTNTAVSPTQAAALLISVAGVLQQPNTGTSIGSNDGFCIDGSSIHFGANLAAHPDFVIWMKASGSHVVADNSVNESKLNISNAPTNGQFLQAQSGNTGGLTWATAGSGTPEGTAILSTGESGGTKFLREDGDGTCSWQAAGSGTPEGTVILSTGESGTTKFLRVDGDGSCSWQVPPDTNTQLSTEQVQDIVGAMFSGNTETNITATYEDSDGTIDLVSTDTVYTHPNHSGEVTSTADGATVIASNIVDEDNLKVSNGPTNGYVLTARSGDTGGMTWETTQTAIGQITEHKATMTANHTIGTGNNGLVAGPFSPGSYTLTIPSGSTFTVV